MIRQFDALASRRLRVPKGCRRGDSQRVISVRGLVWAQDQAAVPEKGMQWGAEGLKWAGMVMPGRWTPEKQMPSFATVFRRASIAPQTPLADGPWCSASTRCHRRRVGSGRSWMSYLWMR